MNITLKTLRVFPNTIKKSAGRNATNGLYHINKVINTFKRQVYLLLLWKSTLAAVNATVTWRY